MIISNQQIQYILKAYGQKPVNKGTVKTGGTAAGEGRDQAQLSPEAKALQAALAAVKEAPEVREEKVAELREAVRSGTYNVSAQEIADKMLGRLLVDELV
ncbi:MULTISPECIES: flagellar biosynthesis anti-sigma factor FlgM [unclassified Carboxydocella]|uniref:flagellar biosynthesis anti-sigma factor FlgM n=1 Tax=unclassified Carboxydocella TaxID=2685367 RepID=UPI0009AF098D|nr:MULTISPECIES: flagellar biosynthesis anti-sigma factor FlgM [unclassified Carboxydocella]